MITGYEIKRIVRLSASDVALQDTLRAVGGFS